VLHGVFLEKGKDIALGADVVIDGGHVYATSCGYVADAGIYVTVPDKQGRGRFQDLSAPFDGITAPAHATFSP
jgi:hypothetical protein